MAIFEGVMSKIEFGQNWRYGYVLYYEFGSKMVIPNFPQHFLIIIGRIGRFIKKAKIHFLKKNAIFLVENLLEKGQNWFNSKTTIVPSPHEHSLQTYNNGFFISQHRFSRHFPPHTPKMAILA